ncbi:G5 domain-containing protein [Anaerococcus urinomassiliensis]|uniref:G5 domain-containing protein n=1 Tax=Anaerococcus urinomassiliensis TaxID=1745712 RepID=UPI00093BA175|nr:G5 domain-containing protein [Anaerococcus urinomassiliensis]
MINNKKSIIPLSNETIKKALLGATIIAGGFGLMGNTNEVYADSVPSYIADELDGVYDETIVISDDSASTTSAQSTQIERKEQAVSAQTYSSNATEEISTALEMSEANVPAAQKASDEPNHAEDDKKVGKDSDPSQIDQTKAETDLAQGAELAGGSASTRIRSTYAVAESNAPNYKKDEEKVGEYAGNDLGDTGQYLGSTQEDEKESIKYVIFEPSKNPGVDKKKFGFVVRVGKDRDRTFADLLIQGTNASTTSISTGTKELLDIGKEPLEGYKVNYKPGETVSIGREGRGPLTLTFAGTEELLNYINTHKDITFGFVDHYTEENTDKTKQIFRDADVSFIMNPYPNENDEFKVIKLNGAEATDPIAAKGQLVKTGAHIDNLDENALERLVNQTYDSNGNVISEKYLKAEVVTASNIGDLKAELGKEGSDIKVGDVLYRMPKSYYEDGSMFKEAIYKGLKALDVRFYVRPRKAEEFNNVSTAYNEYATYKEPTSDAQEDDGKYGEESIKQGDKDVTISKQGIARYDHYNSVGNILINLDDTQYYDQVFKDEKGKILSNTEEFYPIKPSQPVEVAIRDKKGEYGKDAADMKEAEDNGLVKGTINTKDAEKNGWKIDITPGDSSKFTVTPPATAQPGDKIAVPVTYRYTNGSIDVHWFHFEIPETDNNLPSYDVKVDYPSKSITSPIKVQNHPEKNNPKSYTIEDKIYKDDRGNEWTVSIDDNGNVTATPSPDGTYNGGEKLTVPVTVEYENTTQTETTNAEFVLKEKTNLPPDFNAKAGKTGDTLKSAPKVNTEDTYNRKPASYSFENGETTKDITDDKGNTWTVEINPKTGEVTATVPEAAEGKTLEGAVLDVPVVANYKNADGTDAGTENAKVQFFAVEAGKSEPAPQLAAPRYDAKVVDAGESQSAPVDTGDDENATKPTRYSIPEGTTYTDSKGNTWDVSIDEKTGEVTATAPNAAEGETLDLNGAILDVPVTAHYEDAEGNEIATKKASVQFIGTGTEGKHTYTEEIPFVTTVEYDPDFYTNYPDEENNYKLVTEGVNGSKKTELTIVDSKVTDTKVVEETKPTNAVIKVGEKDYTGTFETKKTSPVEFETEYVVDNSLEPGTTVVEQEGSLGEEETTVTHKIENGKVVESTEGEKTQTKAPTKRIVKVGPAKTDGTHTYTNKKPFDVEVRVNPELPKGEYNVIQEGVEGEEEVTVTIENSKVTETSEPKETKAPVNEIIEIGSEDYTGTLEYTDKDPVPFETEVTIDPSLAPNEIVEDQAGVLGEKETKITRTITNGQAGEEVRGEETQTKDPVTRKIRVGAKTDGTHTYTNKKPFDVEVRVNPNLPKGEYNVIQEGVEGEEEITVTIENSKVTKTSEPKETKAPVNEIIEIGSEDYTGVVTHTEHFEIPFEVEVRYNDELPAGTSKEIQKGEKGSYDVEYKQAIKNGQADGELSKTETNRTEAKKHIIEVGTKVETPENNYSKDVEVEIEYVYDDTKDKGVVETGELTPGKVETKVVDKYNPETGKIEQTTEEVVTKAKQKVIVGTKDFTGTYEYEDTCPVPFEVEIKEDPTLAKGERVVDQEGAPGSKTTKYEQDIENGKAVGERRVVEEKITTEPKKHIVRVGTKPAEGSTEKVVEREIPYETKVIYDETLEAGSQKIENEGKPGKEEVTITQKVKDSKPVGDPTETTKTITEKEDRVVRIGVKPVEKIVELGHYTEYRHNPELKEGETKVIEEGSNGSVKYTTTFNKETGKLEVKEERVEPKNKVVEYGSKTEGEFKFESEQAFDIIIKENPNLEAGETNVIQEGIVGKTETTVKIENSKEVDRTTKTITEKQDKIIEIGTKNVCEIPPVDPENPDKPADKNPENPDKPGDKDPENPDKPADKDPENPDKPGDKDPENPDKPGDKDPENPDKPGDKDPENPDKPGDKDPENPDKPGDKDPENPDKPGDKDPENPDKPGDKDPEEPGKPGDKDPEKPGKPGDNDSEKPGKPGEEKPEEPGKPGEEKPTEPGKPGEDKPTEPGKPGEDKPEEPGKPGEDKPTEPSKPGEEKPTEPGKPGEDKPEEPGKPGEDKPEEPGKPGEEKPNELGKPNTPETENPKYPEKPNYNGNNNIVTNPGNKSENNKTVETETLNNQKTQKDSSSKDGNKTANTNVKTGVSGTISVASILAAASAGLLASKKKKEDE